MVFKAKKIPLYSHCSLIFNISNQKTIGITLVELL